MNKNTLLNMPDHFSPE
jgi:hypothetical protein